ncbi:hypothetical protein BDW72DRAFT_181453 [Aspergillus terricola var. indicus]
MTTDNRTQSNPPADESRPSETAPRVLPAKPAATQSPKADWGTTEPLIEFVNYNGTTCMTNPNDPNQIDEKIRDILTSKRILKQDKRVGYLYVFSGKTAPGMYKVGYTSNLRDRKTKLEKCYGDLELRCFVECPNARLFENVVHAELLPYRRKHQCPKHALKADGTEREHTEWFKADLQDIFDTIMAWSLYARMLYRRGLFVDKRNHGTPLPGAATRADRWRRWALMETGRWMDGLSSKVSVVPKIAAPEKNVDADPSDESDSECESIFSSPVGHSGTPSTTPATTPETTPGLGDHEKDDYDLSPTPAEKYTRSSSLEIYDDDDGDLEVRPKKPVERVLFVPKKTSPAMQQKDLPFVDIQGLWSTRIENTANSDTSPVLDNSPTDIPPSKLVDDEIRSLLAKNPCLTENPGTIYVAKHTEKDLYKMYYRKKDSPRKSKECFTRLTPYFEIQCTNTLGIQSLVMAQFADFKKSYKCGKCDTTHNNWINASGEVITASLRAWTELVDMGYDDTKDSLDVLSQGTDRWTTWAREAVAKSRGDDREAKNKQEEAQENESSSATDETPTGESREISRSGTDAASEGSSKDRGHSSRPTRIIRRMSNLKAEMTSQGSDGSLWPRSLLEWLMSMLFRN